MGHSVGRSMTPPDNKSKRGRPPLGAKGRSRNLSVRVRDQYHAALLRLARREQRDITDMARVIIGEHLVRAGLLPADFEF